jgi:hypothetical protein
MAQEKQQIYMTTRVPEILHGRILAEQQRITKATGIKPSLNEVTNMLIEKGLKANGKGRAQR